ncbi:MAG: hypothetical protein DHS20C17_10280 [Cyclobacteriaceae bacterium]|nr:MAG: hypothetical protein DHS20C17_10280 [Cyclobacteriaceae bacterium]
MKKPHTVQEVAVWDTYVNKQDGSVMHFDIIVPAHIQDQEKIFEFGEQYVKQKGELAVNIDVTHCQFCHVETITKDIADAISKQGYYILEMEDIPGKLSPNPTRRDLALYLKAHFEKYRFTNFSGVSSEEIQRLILIEEELMNKTKH